VNIIIDGKNCECEKGEFLRDIAFRNDVFIPGLCHSNAMPGSSCCRVCLVEIAEKGERKVVSSCVYPVEDICVVFTDSEKVRELRAMVLTLLSKYAPESDMISAMANANGAFEISRMRPAEKGKCIMCGSCVRVCSELGAGAISAVNRGITKKISTPYSESNPDCIGCMSCAKICPVNAIDAKETADNRSIWGKDFTLLYCPECGEVTGTAEEIAFAAKKTKTEVSTLCRNCRKKKMADQIALTYGL